MIDLPIGRQTFDFDCGAKVLQLVMAYYGVDVREDELIKDLKTCDIGTRVNSMIKVAEKNGFKVYAKSRMLLKTVKKYVDNNQPVIVLVQAWADRYMTLKDWKEDNENGHYVIVIGYRKDTIVFEDPSSIRRTWLKEDEFIARWHDVDPRTKQRLIRFGMILRGKEPAKKTMEHMD